MKHFKPDVPQDETELRRLQQHFELAEHAAHAGAWDWDIVQDQHYWSPALMRLFGLNPEDGGEGFDAWTAWRKVLHPEDREESEARFKSSLEARQPFAHTYRIILPSGEVRWIDGLGRVILDDAGEPLHYAGLCLDVTARKVAEIELEKYCNHLEELVEERATALRHMERRSRLLLESAANGLLGVDTNACIVFANPAACEMLGYSAEELLGKDAHALLHHHRPDGSPYPAEECSTLRALHSGEVIRNDYDIYWHRDGHAIPLIASGHPLVEAGRVTGMVLSLVDVSMLRSAAIAKEQALVAAEQLSLLRQEFLRNMTHELRTPLNGVLGFAHIGLRNTKNPEKCANAFEKIAVSGKRALELVDDILDFSMLESGTLVEEPTAFSPERLVNSAVLSVQGQAKAKGLRVEANMAADVPHSCIGLPGQLSRVLRELLDNAVKFTPSGHVGISVVHEAAQDEDWLVFKVTDTGPGIEKERLVELFEPFHQLDSSSTRAFGGAGLGLALVDRLVKGMGGQTRVESTPGLSCRFEIRVPCKVSTDGKVMPEDER